jgi:formate hydrogenlyase subunit 6/NADH:ubiquinone oxidoreductase subunit I
VRVGESTFTKLVPTGASTVEPPSNEVTMQSNERGLATVTPEHEPAADHTTVGTCWVCLVCAFACAAVCVSVCQRVIMCDDVRQCMGAPEYEPAAGPTDL